MNNAKLATYLLPCVQFQYSGSDLFDIVEGDPEDAIPRWVFRQRDLQLPACEPNARARNRFGAVANEDVRPQGIIHVVPVGES